MSLICCNRTQILFRSVTAVDIMSDQVIDIARHAGTESPVGPIPRPLIGGSFVLHENVIKGKRSTSVHSNILTLTVKSISAASNMALEMLTPSHRYI